MNSGEWISLYWPICAVIFIAWELLQLARRRAGNKSARTMSQWVIYKMKAESKRYRWQDRPVTIACWCFCILLILIGIILIPHWEMV